MYFKSENVKVFPSAFRGKNDSDLWFDPEALMQTEYNIVSPKQGLLESYICEYDDIADTDTPQLKCVIGGYYFEIYNEASLDSLNAIGNNVYLSIKVSPTALVENGGTVYKDTYKLDSFADNVVILDTKIDGEYKFTGLVASDEIDENATAYLQIIKDGQINSSAFLPQIETGSSADGKAIQLGANTEASGDSSLALGAYTYAIGENSVAEGNYTVAYGENSHASGEGEQFSDTTSNAFTVTNVDQISENKVVVRSATGLKVGHILVCGNEYTKITAIDSNTLTLSLVPSGIVASDSPILYHIQNIAYGEAALTNGQNNSASGNASHSEGYQTVASGDYSHAEGHTTAALANQSHAEGRGTSAENINSHAEGFNTRVYNNGQAGHAEGRSTEVTSEAAHAEGFLTYASGQYGHSEGFHTKASGKSAHAEGGVDVQATQTYTEAIGDFSHAEGYSTQASGKSSHAEGYQTKTKAYVDTNDAGGQYAHAEGKLTEANAEATHAEGNNTKANAEGAHTEGQNTEVDGTYSHAEGDTTEIRQADYAHAEGSYTLIDSGSIAGHTEGRATVVSNEYAHAEGIGNFEGELDITNTKGQASGKGAHSEGELTVASGRAAHSEGYDTAASNNYAHAEGKYTVASGIGAHAEGGNPEPDDEDEPTYNIAQGNFSHAEGQGTKALGAASHAEGVGTLANGFGAHAEGNTAQAGTKSIPANSAHAEGDSTKAENTASHAEGYKTRATGKYAHAEGESDGNLKNAEGQSSHSEGYYTKALGKYSHAEGNNTRAYGEGAHAEGLGTIAQNDYELVVGKYNKYAVDSDEEPVADTRLFVVGAGTKTGNNDPVRKNAFEVIEDTTKTSQGGFDIKVGENSLQDIIKSYLLDYIYPIGAIYVSEYQNDGETGPDNKRRPNTVSDPDKNGCPIAELGGKWERIQGTFIYAAEVTRGTQGAGDPGESYGINKFGGEKDWELLKHTHNVKFGTTAAEVNEKTLTSEFWLAGWLNGAGYGGHNIIDSLSSGGIVTMEQGSTNEPAIDDVVASGNKQKRFKTKINATHKHTFNPSTLGLEIVENGDTNNAVGRNMPPYTCMYMWKRIK